MRLAFVHLPKTGGTYIKAALAAGGVTPVYLGHVHAALDAIANVPEVGPIYSCCFVRHPADWLASLWAWRKANPERIARSALWGMPHHDDWASQVDLHTDVAAGEIGTLFSEFTAGVDFVGSTPSLKAGLIQALNSAGISYDAAGLNSVPPLNVTPGKPTILPPQASKIEAAEAALMSAHNPGRG